MIRAMNRYAIVLTVFGLMIGNSKPIAAQQDDHSAPLNISELDSVKQQIEQCWNVPASVRNTPQPQPEFRVSMNADGTVRTAELLNPEKLSNPLFQAAADSARRAILNPLCQPLKLPPDKYSQWQTFTIMLDPSDLSDSKPAQNEVPVGAATKASPSEIRQLLQEFSTPAPNGGDSPPGSPPGHKWQHVEADNGAIFAVDITSIKDRTAVIYNPYDTVSPLGLYSFDCNGHYAADVNVPGMGFRWNYAAPHSVMGEIAIIVCGG